MNNEKIYEKADELMRLCSDGTELHKLLRTLPPNENYKRGGLYVASHIPGAGDGSAVIANCIAMGVLKNQWTLELMTDLINHAKPLEKYKVWAIEYEQGTDDNITVAVSAESEYGAIKRLCGSRAVVVKRIELIKDRKPEYDERRIERRISYAFKKNESWIYSVIDTEV